MKSNLDQCRQELETAGLAFSYRMVSGLLIMGAVAVTILVVGLRYISRDYTSKSGEIAAGMRQLAEGDHDFSIEGQHREDELGDMVRALQQFQRANVRLQQWARQRGWRADEQARTLGERVRGQDGQASGQEWEGRSSYKRVGDEIIKKKKHT